MNIDKINPANFRHRITFQKKAKTPDGAHGKTIVWNNIATVWAKVRPLHGRERFYAHQIVSDVSHEINVRYNANFTEEMRIVFEERILKIESIIDINELRKFMEIYCIEEK